MLALTITGLVQILFAQPIMAADANAAVAQTPSKVDDGQAKQKVQLFLSPAGEPFWADKGEAYPSRAWFERADANKDGQLSLSEYLADARRYFDALDQDKSSVLEAAEIDAYEDAVLSPLRREGGSAAAGKRGLPVPMQDARQYGLIAVPHPVKAADKDMNARVTWPEYQAVLESRFKALDKGSFGYLQLQTLPKTQAQQRQEDEKPSKKKRG